MIDSGCAQTSDLALEPSKLVRFIVANTALLSPPLVPEIKLHLATESLPIWHQTEEALHEVGLPPPFWAFAWAGGQALARHILDNPELVAGKRVLDLASGSGLVAIAAMQAGAVSALAADVDAFAAVATRLNATANGVTVEVTSADLIGGSEFVQTAAGQVQVILAGDMFYERPMAERGLSWLSQCRAAGLDVLVGDPGRSYFPKDRFVHLAEYSVPVTRELEDSEIKYTAVWRLA